MPEAELEPTLAALRFVPASEHGLFHDGQNDDKNAAWRYATHHHNGTIGNLLATYRQARNMAIVDLPALKINQNTKQAVSQYEKGERSEFATSYRAVSFGANNPETKRDDGVYRLPDGSLENMWDLPMDEQGKEIRADVIKYIDHFRARSDARKPPAAHWKTVENIFDDLAETPAGINLDLDIYRNSPVMGRHTEALREEKQHPLLAKINGIIDEQLALYPDEPLPLITLPNGVELLVKRGEAGEPPRLLESELPLWRDWLLSEAKHISAPSARRAQAVSDR